MLASRDKRKIIPGSMKLAPHQQEMVSSMGELTQGGGAHVASGHIGEIQYTAIDTDGNAELHRLSPPYFEAVVRTTKGLRMVGVTRKHGLLRRFIDCSYEEIEAGDRVVLKDEEGKKVKTSKVNSVVIQPSSATAHQA